MANLTTNSKIASCVAASFISALILAACGSDSSSTPVPTITATIDDVDAVVATQSRDVDGTVLASKGNIDTNIIIPDSALPTGLNSQDITAKVFTLDSKADGVSGVSFKLEPDGTKFKKPILLQWNGPWDEANSYSLNAFSGDGTPIADSGSTISNSVLALQVEPTSKTTARYTLPIDHFSTWSVAIYRDDRDTNLYYNFSADTNLNLVVNTPTVVKIKSVGGRVFSEDNFNLGLYYTATECGSTVIKSISGPITAKQESNIAQCNRKPTIYPYRIFPMTFECTDLGSASVSVSVFQLILYAVKSNSEADQLSEDKMRMLLLTAAFPLNPDDEDTANIDQGNLQGGVATVPMEFTINCVSNLTTTIAETTTSVAESTTTTRPPVTTSVATANVATTNVATTNVATTSPAPIVATTSLPVQAVTSSLPPATTTSTSQAPSTPALPPGSPGTWAYNATWCDWNDDGVPGCGLYYGNGGINGSLWLGPEGGPGVTIPPSRYNS